MASDVFISHSREDTDFARRLADILGRQGIVAVTDTEPTPGEDWAEHLARALDSSDAMVLLLSPAALNSPLVMSEVGAALASEKLVIPVVPPNRRVPRDVPSPIGEMHLLRAGKLSDAEIASSVLDSLRHMPVRQMAR